MEAALDSFAVRGYREAMRLPFFSQRRNVASDAVPPATAVSKSPLEVVLQYHEETKHHYHRFARSLGYLDWANQPDPFRRFSDARLVSLPLLEQSDLPAYRDVFSPGLVPSVTVDLNSISRLFRNSLAISAWKHHENTRWALRVNPSSGNLHPTEGYGILGDLTPELRAGVYHYAPQIHALEQRTELASDMFAFLSNDFPAGSFFVGLTSIHWREAWKYGERAYRYCQQDLGHAIAAMRLSAAALGWQLLLLDELSDQEVALLLGLHVAENFEQAEDEYPHCIAVVVPSADSIGNAATIRPEVIQKIADCSWTGRANRLSESHMDWQIVNVVAEAASKLRTEICELRPSLMKFSPPDEIVSMEKIIQQRRSAVAMDGHAFLGSRRFFGMLARVISDANAVPFDVFRRSELANPR
ncbi:MAG TPA: SagB/ThcOx family dehydrogenase, partial [Acidobacteriota bacterium]|nr:SagB/ThcOx family dehydrogenase [Acidobacteriota bacterium]